MLKVPEEESEQDFEAKYFNAYKNLNKQDESNDNEQEKERSKSDPSSKDDSRKSVSLPSAFKKQSSSIVKSDNESKKTSEHKRESKGSVEFDIPTLTSKELLTPTFHDKQRESVRYVN